MSPMQAPRVVFITGASSGFGRSFMDIALANGDNVVATLRKPDVLRDLQDRTPSDRLLVLKVDVTKEDEILDAFTKAKEKFGRIDVVFNNAGYVFSSVIESTPEDVARALFETNFWGAVRVSREAIRFFRDENPNDAGGRLI
ncbi:NAD-P-binding protein, partial [Irpex rosettiformis]